MATSVDTVAGQGLDMVMRLTSLLLFLLLAPAACSAPAEEAASEADPDPTPRSSVEAVAPEVAILEEVLIAAYTGAADYSSSNGNYFARNQKEEGELAGSVSSALADLPIGVGSSYATDEKDLTLCSPYDTPMVRIIAQGSGDELVLVASDQTTAVTLTYSPGAEPDISDPSPCVPLRS